MIRNTLFALLLVFFSMAGASAAPQPMLEPHAQAMPLSPFLEYLLDESLAMDIDEVASLQNGWQPFALDSLPRAEGNLWLRFHIAPLAANARPRTFLLDMGQSVPGVPILYDPIHNELSNASEWRENVPAQRNVLLLPEAGTEAIPCFIRLEGLPGPWFAPVIRTPQNAANNWDSLTRFGALLALGVVMMLCIFRSLGERGQWRYWTALFVGMALLQGLLGMPVESQHFGIRDLAATLCPGLALMFLPHAGRHLMQARQHSRSIDIQLFLLSLPGAALALLPLAPGFNWLDRWVDLWPLGMLLFIPTALGAWLMRLPGSGRFLLACVLPPLFVAAGLLGMEFGIFASVLSAAPLWGIAFSALLLATCRSPEAQGLLPQTSKAKDAKREDKKKNKKSKFPSLALHTEEPIINLERPLDDPNLRIIPNEELLETVEETPPVPVPPSQPTVRESEPVQRMLTPATSALMEGEARELAMRKPLDDILRESAALSMCSLPPVAREAVVAVNAAARRLASILSREELPAEDEDAPASARDMGTFNLQQVLRHAHDSVASVSECAGVALSWYMPPQLPPIYAGSARSLETTLRMLLESSARSTKRGSIKLSARQVPGSTEAGHVLFTVQDDGDGFPPHERSSLALAKAWELAGEFGGFLSVESSPSGTTIAFTAHLVPAENANSELPHIILASDDDGKRWHLARMLEAMPVLVDEATDAAGVLALQEKYSANVLVAQGRMAVPAAGDLVRDFNRMAREKGFNRSSVLALTMDDSHWGLLKASGFTHAILEPVDPEVLRRTVANLLKENAGEEAAEDDLFRSQAASLTAKKQRHIDAQAPTMLIEQDFGVRTNFEGPDWLGEEEANQPEECASGEGQPAAEIAHPPQSDLEGAAEGQIIDTGAPPLNETLETLPQAQKQQGADENLVADGPLPWHGKDYASDKDEAASTAKDKDFWTLNMPEQVDTPSTTSADTAASKDDANKPLLDFIVGVENAVPMQTAETNQLTPQVALNSPASKSLESTDAARINKKAAAEVAQKRQESAAQTMPIRKNIDTQAPPKEAVEAVQPPKKPEHSGDSAINVMLEHLDLAMQNALAHYNMNNGPGVSAATEHMAAMSERFGLRVLTRMAQCVQRAAQANDMGALNDLLPELANAVERTRILVLQKQSGK